MSNPIPNRRRPLRMLTTACGVALLTVLVWRAGPSKLVDDVARLGWGIVLILALGGIPHVLKAWAWRFTLLKESRKVTFSQLLRLRLASEAIGNLGALGQVFGEGIRISALNSEIPAASRISSVTLDRALFILTGAVFSLIGIVVALSDHSISHAFRSYAELFVLVVLALLIAASLTVRRGWRVLSRSTRLLAKLGLARQIESRQGLIESVEARLLGFYNLDRRAFWTSVSLNFLCQAMTTVEIYLIFRLMGANIGLLSAFIFDALMKLVNAIGTINPGNVGTYEAGTVLIAGMFKIGAPVGLAVAVTRRLRALFWAAVGAGCLVAVSRGKRKQERSLVMSVQLEDITVVTDEPGRLCSSMATSPTAVIVANNVHEHFTVGTLPVALRLILSLEKAGVSRIILCADPTGSSELKKMLVGSKRLPASVEWYEVHDGHSLSNLLASMSPARCMISSSSPVGTPPTIQLWFESW